MPRQIDVQCPKCGFVEEVQKDIVYFEDDEPSTEPCPQCHYAMRKELPPMVSIQTKKRSTHLITFPKKPRKLAPDGVMPDEIRKALAKELFDPCSCGEHAPADLYEHDEDCHNRLHTFMKNEKIEKNLEAKK